MVKLWLHQQFSIVLGVVIPSCSNVVRLHPTYANAVNRVVDSCPESSLDGGLPRLHSADEYAIPRLNSVAKEALAK